MSFSFPAKTYLVILSFATGGFLLAHLVLNYIYYEVADLPWLVLQLFELDEENNLPTWFSSFLLLNNACVLLFAGLCATTHRPHWLTLAAGFLLLAIDEVAGLHETFHTSIDNNWTLYAAPLVLVVGLFYLQFLLALPRKIAALFIISGLLYLGGALGIEWLAQDMDEDTLEYAYVVGIEEGMEMMGALLFLWVNLSRLRTEATEISLTFR